MKKRLIMIMSTVALVGTGLMSTAWAALAVDFGADYVTAVQTFTKTLTYETGDYGFDGGSDRRGYRINDTLTLPAVANKNNILHSSVQIANFNSTVNPSLNKYELVNGAPFDAIAANNIAGTADMSLVLTPYVVKADFLGGADAVSNLSFENAAGSAAFTMRLGTALTTARVLVQNGSSWYVSATEYTSPLAGSLSLNGYTQTWYAYDPSANLFLNTGALGSGVAGSMLTDIQAVGVLAQAMHFNGSTANAVNLQVSAITANLIPEPATIGMLGLGALATLLFRRLRSKE